MEFVLLLPLLVLLGFGVVDFSRAHQAQDRLTAAAREGARLTALRQADVVSRTQAAAAPLIGVGVLVTACPAGATGDAVVLTSYSFALVTPVSAIARLFGSGFGGPIAMTAQSVVRCQG